MLGVAGCRDEHLVGYLWEDLGEPRARDADDTLVAAGVDGVLLLQPARPGNPLGIDMGNRELRHRPVLLDQMDDTPVGETRHGEPRDVRQRRFDVERGGKRLSRFGQEPLDGFDRFCAVVSCQTLTAYTTLPAVSVTGEERTIDQRSSPVFWMRKRRVTADSGSPWSARRPGKFSTGNDWPFSSKRANCPRTSVTGAARSSAALANPSACAAAAFA